MTIFWISVVLAVAAFIGTAFELSDMLDGVFDLVMIVLTGLMAASFAWATIFFGATGIANLALDHHDHYRRVDLVAIRDGSGIQGTFVWGTGTVGSSGDYMFYYQDGNAKRLVKVDGSSVDLFEDSKDAYAIQFTGCELSWSWLSICFSNESHFDQIHVPAGTVKGRVDLGLNQ
jgi:hypothetical protein